MINIDLKTVTELKATTVFGIDSTSKIVTGTISGWLSYGDDTLVYVITPGSARLSSVKIEDCFETEQEAINTLKEKLGIA